MSQAGPILFVSDAQRPAFVAALDEARLFPVVDTDWASAARAVDEVQPAAVLAAMHAEHEPPVTALAKKIADQSPYVPFVTLDAAGTLPHNALPFSSHGGNPERLIARLRAALRVRTLHATVLRRLPEAKLALPEGDPARDATVLLIGRGAAYPALSVALGERFGVVGALSIEAAAKHLNTRDLDGVVLAEGFTARVTDAFLTVLAEDTRFRSLPVVVTAHELTQAYDLPNLELIPGEPAKVAANALPLIRQHAMEAQLSRTLRSIDAGGWLDPRSGLLTVEAFARDFAKAVEQALARGGGLLGRALRFRSRQFPRPARCRTDSQPPDAADGFRYGAEGRFSDRRVRGDRLPHGAHDRPPSVGGDAAHVQWQARDAQRSRGQCGFAVPVGYGAVAAGATIGGCVAGGILKRDAITSAASRA